MGFKIGMFKTPKYKVFNYQPLYYDERKEALNDKIEMAEREQRGEYVPGDMVKRAFKRNRIDVKRTDGAKTITRVITVLTLAAIMMAILYFTEFMNLFLY